MESLLELKRTRYDQDRTRKLKCAKMSDRYRNRNNIEEYGNPKFCNLQEENIWIRDYDIIEYGRML